MDATLVKVMAWYDNEWGFTQQMIREARSNPWTGQRASRNDSPTPPRRQHRHLPAV